MAGDSLYMWVRLCRVATCRWMSIPTGGRTQPTQKPTLRRRLEKRISKGFGLV
jgi:hypothetical protein